MAQIFFFVLNYFLPFGQFKALSISLTASIKRQKHFQKFSSQTGSRPNASNQLAGVTSLYQTSRLVTRLFKNEMIHSNSFTKSSCNTEQHGTSCSISTTVLHTEMSSHSSKLPWGTKMFCSTSQLISSHQ